MREFVFHALYFRAILERWAITQDEHMSRGWWVWERGGTGPIIGNQSHPKHVESVFAYSPEEISFKIMGSKTAMPL